MNDTTEAAAQAFRRRFETLSAVERVRMGFDMCEFSRRCARLGIRADHPELSPVEVEQRLFLRMYGDELPPAVVERALARIARAAETAAG